MRGAGSITRAEFAALMARVPAGPSSRAVGVAVSGGADSLCLAWLAHRWGAAIALIVDHGLREGSDAEAALTARSLTEIGMSVRISRLSLPRGAALAARARTARYAALTEMAASEGLLDLLVGHHARDQAETVLIREAARSGPAGLSAMASLTETASLRIVRPLLGVAPVRLRATLTEAGLAWIEDPSNDNPSAQRSQIRRRLADRNGDGAWTASLAESAASRGLCRAAAERETAALLAERVTIHPEGYALLSPGPIAPAALSALIRTVGGTPYPARIPDVARLARDPRPATLAGVQLLPAGRLGPGWLLVREANAMAAATPAMPGALWDRRFRLPVGAEISLGQTIGGLGADAAQLRTASPLPAAILRTMPCLRRDGRLIGVAEAAIFAPLHPLAGAGFFV